MEKQKRQNIALTEFSKLNTGTLKRVTCLCTKTLFNMWTNMSNFLQRIKQQLFEKKNN